MSKGGWQRTVLVFLVLCACVGGDQISKEVARDRLLSSPPISLLNGVFVLECVQNSGAFLGLGSGLPEPVRFWALTALVGGVLMGGLVFVLTARKLNLAAVVALSLMVGGGLSNLFDRLFNAGTVVDFMNIGLGNVRTGIFNVADVAIVAGILVLLAGSWKRPAI